MDCDKCYGFGTYKTWDPESETGCCSCCFDYHTYTTVWCDCPRALEIRELYDEGEERERQAYLRRLAEREAERLREADESARRIRARWAEFYRLRSRTPIEIQEDAVRSLEVQLTEARAKLSEMRLGED